VLQGEEVVVLEHDRGDVHLGSILRIGCSRNL
jgi:hypothetical protein